MANLDAAPPFSKLTAPKTPLPKATPQGGKTAGATPPMGRGYNPQAPIPPGPKPNVDGLFGSSGDGTHAVHIDQAGSDKVAGIRKQLIQAGYNVASHGPGTNRLSKAYAHFTATNGGGAKVWNAHNVQIQHPAFTGHPVAGPVHAQTAVVPPASASTLPSDSNLPGGSNIPPALQALLDKEFQPYSGDQGLPTLIDPVKLAAQQADQQYGAGISQGQRDIQNMQGAEPGAQANISKYFAPTKVDAAAAIGSGDAASAENVAANAKLSTGLMAALGLKGADGGSLASTGQSEGQYSSDIGQIQHADALANQSATDRREQQAHTTEDSNSTIALADARAKLIDQLNTKGSAQSVDEATNRQQNFVNRTQGIANQAAITNIDATRGLAKTNIISGLNKNTQEDQTLGINKTNTQLTQRQAQDTSKQAAANLQQTLINNKRLTETPIPGSTTKATTKIPFGQVNVGDRDTLAAGMWAKVGNLDPAKAERQINNYMTQMYGYASTPAIRAWAKSVVQQHQWDPGKKKYAQ